MNLRGEESQGEFCSNANNMQQADAGTKMIHLGRDTESRIVSKSIRAGKAQKTYRGLVSMHPNVFLIVNGFVSEVLQALPMEFSMQAPQLVAISLDGSEG